MSSLSLSWFAKSFQFYEATSNVVKLITPTYLYLYLYPKPHCIFLQTAGVAILLTIITYFSSPILTSIFGDGSLEVAARAKKHK